MTPDDADAAIEHARAMLLEAGWATAFATHEGNTAMQYPAEGLAKLRALAALLGELADTGRTVDTRTLSLLIGFADLAGQSDAPLPESPADE